MVAQSVNGFEPSLYQGLRLSLRRAPPRFLEGLPAEEGEGVSPSWDEVAEILADEPRRRIAARWQELRVRRRSWKRPGGFGGEVLQPGVWQELKEAKEALRELAGEMEAFGGPAELPEPHGAADRGYKDHSGAGTGSVLREMRGRL